MAKISPSVLGADYLTLKENIRCLESAGTDMLHMDVMDGIFVPNISFGVPVIKSIKKHTSLPLDVHLMIDRPHRYLKDFLEVSDYLGFHFEAGSNVEDTLKEIKECGKKTCITIKPMTSPEVITEFLPLCDMVLIMSVEPGFGGQKFMPSALPKLEFLSNYRKEHGMNFLLEIDGGINRETASLAIKSGADVLVVGNYLFSADDMVGVVKDLKSL